MDLSLSHCHGSRKTEESKAPVGTLLSNDSGLGKPSRVAQYEA
jgi:hypothetical protein